MRAVNLYILTRNVEKHTKAMYEKALSERNAEIKVREEEYDMILRIVRNLLSYHCSFSVFENWYYSFTIPQIGKEYDLLRIGSNHIINVELKSQEVSEDKVIRQLKQNRSYLYHINKTIYSYTFMVYTDGTARLMRYTPEQGLKEASFRELLTHIKTMKDPLQEGIEKLFKPADYLISPIHTPQKFLEGRYYLNNQQENIKNSIIKGIKEGRRLWGIQGSAGTGKTLLLYDLARTLAEEKRICVVHCGALSDGHRYLNRQLNNPDVIDAKSLQPEEIVKYDIVLLDESQRLNKNGVDLVLDACRHGQIQAAVFAYDYEQVLTVVERKRNNPKYLRQIPEFEERSLKERVRTNPGICSFVRTMLRLYDQPNQSTDYSNVEIVYANDRNECDQIVSIYLKRDYTYITFTPTQEAADNLKKQTAHKNSRQVIGLEYDKVVQIMDEKFFYSPQGDLRAKEQRSPTYLFANLFYQNITRTREKLCIIVLNNPAVFDVLLKIKEHKYDELNAEHMMT